MVALKNMDSSGLAEHVKAHGAPVGTARTEKSGGHADVHGPGSHVDQPRQLHHMYVPMAQKGHMLEGGKKVPVHNLHVYSRSQFLSNLMDSGFRTGNLGASYKAYFWAVVCFVLTVLTYNVNLYLAAAFAFMAGTYWSQRLIQPPWNITWFKGKTKNQPITGKAKKTNEK